MSKINIALKTTTGELHFYGIIGKASHLDMHKIRIIGFFFFNRLFWEFEVENVFYERLF